MSENLLLTTTVGSFGKPEYLTKARGQVARGKLGATELEELERKATAEWIRRQEDIGLDVATQKRTLKDLRRGATEYFALLGLPQSTLRWEIMSENAGT